MDRSITWMQQLLVLSNESWEKDLQKERSCYDLLKQKLTLVPASDPLSLSENNPWNDYFKLQDLKTTIMLDVVRM